MRSKEYWQKRSEAVLLAAEREGNDLVRELNGFYAETTDMILRDMEAFYGRYAKDNAITVQDAKKRLEAPRLEAFRTEMERYYAEAKRLGLGNDYKEYLRRLSGRGYVSRQEELLAQVRHQTELLANCELESFLGALGSVYEHSYHRTIFDTQQGLGFGVDFNRIDARTVESIIRRPWLGDSFSDRIWKQKNALLTQLDRIIPQGFAIGQGSRELGRRLARQMNTARYNGERLARTEVNHAANEATRASYKELGVERYEFLATLDTRTSEICAGLDGKVFRLADAQAGTNYPPMHPNCRSTTVPYFAPDEFDEPGKRAARDDRGKYVTVPADMTYDEWKKAQDDGTMRAQHLENIPVTQEAIDRVPLVRSPVLDDAANQRLQQEHKRLLTRAMQFELGTEVGGTYRLDMSGLSQNDGRLGAQQIVLPDHEEPYVAVHTHPSGGTFTAEDMELFIRRPNLAVLTAVGHDGDVYVLSKTDQYDVDAMYRSYQRLRKELKPHIDDADLFSYATRMERYLEEVAQYGAKADTGTA